MFGVLVVADREGRIGYLAAFSGMLEGRWSVDGFVDPLFDLAHRDRTWPAVEAQISGFDERVRALSAAQEAARGELATLEARHAAARAERAEQDRQGRDRRQARRAALAAEEQVALQALAQESRADTVAERRLRASQREERAPLAERAQALEEQRVALERQRAARSAELL